MTLPQIKLPWMVDLPPVWLLAAIAAVWAIDRLVPFGLFGPTVQAFGAAVVWLGLALIGIAAGQMLLHRTTVIPGGRPSTLVTGGVFALSRNPIYLADALILAGVILSWDAPLATPLLYGFTQLIKHRFILPEEAVLRDLFGAAYTDWTVLTGRWIGLSRQ